VLAELSKLQDRIEPFNTLEARRMIEQELGQRIDVVFSEFSDKPIAAASLAQVGGANNLSWRLFYHPRTSGNGQHLSSMACPARWEAVNLRLKRLHRMLLLLLQVYRAKLRSNGQEVAVKVQRPGALSTISKDLYVMRRGIGVYEQLVKRFTAQTTDYQQLLSTFAEGLYTEMDFRNEVRVAHLACYHIYICHVYMYDISL
jgi:predicted unusual protein kinase regulating ubiquinone biosynthesis (AarF/ABC1/UbiB family)